MEVVVCANILFKFDKLTLNYHLAAKKLPSPDSSVLGPLQFSLQRDLTKPGLASSSSEGALLFEVVLIEPTVEKKNT